MVHFLRHTDLNKAYFILFFSKRVYSIYAAVLSKAYPSSHFVKQLVTTATDVKISKYGNLEI
jgi:hypothetical protein